MNQQDFRKRSLKLIQSGRNKALKTNVIVKQLPDLLRLHPNCQQISFLLNQLNLNASSIISSIKGSQLDILFNNTPIQYIGYLIDYFRLDINKIKGARNKLEEQFILSHDYQSLKVSNDKDQVIKNATRKIQRVLPLFSTYQRKLYTHQALRLIVFLPLESSNQKRIFKQLIKQLQEQVLKIKWEQIYELLDQSIPTRGHYGILIGFIDRSHSQIADGFMKIIRTPGDVQKCLTGLLDQCLAPGLLKVIASITRKIFRTQQIEMIRTLFQKVIKPILLLNLPTSIYYKDIQSVLGATLVKLKQPLYLLKQKDIMPIETHRGYPLDHIRILNDLSNYWVSPYQRMTILTKLQKLQSRINQNKDSDKFSKTQTQISQGSTLPQLSSTSNNIKPINQEPGLQYPKLFVNSQKVINENQMKSNPNRIDQHKVIMFQCDDYIGLPNVGNTCYINSFIQNLLFCWQFMNIYMKANIQKYKVYNLLKKILQQLQQNNKSKLKELLLEFKKQLPTTFSIDDAQQDSMEFGRQLINGLMSVPELQNIIKNIFITKTKMITKCPNGDISSSMEQSNSEMILAFEHPLVVSKLKSQTQINPIKMEQLLNAYFADNQIEGEFRCDKCKKKFNKCLRITQLLELPQTLIIVLSRFMYDVNLQKKRKILDVVNLEDYIHFGNINTNSKIKAKYRLTSFVVHLGNQAESGHYQVYVKHPNQQQYWVIFDDDNSVMQVSCKSAKSLAENLAVEESPYILFYSRI